MGNKIVKETADLKPIGTDNDTNYDLYIKKTGCKLVIEINKNKNKTPTNAANDQTRNDGKTNNKNQNAVFGQYDRPPPGSYGDISFDRVPNRPFHDYEDYGDSAGYDYKPPGYGFMYAPNFYGPPIKVQSSLISVSPIATNDLDSENGANERKNYLSYKDDRYSHYRPGRYEGQGNSLDTAGRPITDRLPPLFSSNYKPGHMYAEESSYEQHSNRFLSSSYEYAAPMPVRMGNRYPAQDERPSPEYTNSPIPERMGNSYPPQDERPSPDYNNYNSRPQFGDLQYEKPHIGDNNEYRPDVYRPVNGNPNFLDHRNHGHDSFEDQKGLDRLYERPTYRPQSTNDDKPNRYYNNWPSYVFEPSYTEFTYGNRYPFYKQSDDKLHYIQTFPIKNDNNANHPVSTNKTEPSGASNITATSFETALNYTEINSTSVSFSNGSIVSQTKGPHGETITSIITELEAGELVPHWLDSDLVSDYYRRQLEVIRKMRY